MNLIEEILKIDGNTLEEKLITFGNKAYPKFGNVVIMAGGAGSGKGFVLDNLVGLEGKVFDVDALKTLAAKAPKIVKKVKEETGKDMKKIASDLKNPDNVFDLHTLVSDVLNIPDKRQSAFFTSVILANPDRKPNVIFDVTLKDLRKLNAITRSVQSLGYDADKIHIVWVVNDIEVAKKQNKERSRTVPEEILINTHKGVSHTMTDILSMGDDLKKYMDGDIVFAFNKVGVDTDLATSKSGGKYVKDANYFYIKRAGKPVTSLKSLDKDIKAKVKKYVPKSYDWD